MATNPLARPIIVDSDQDFLKTLEQESQTATDHPILVRSEADAVQLVTTVQGPVSAVFLNPQVGNSLGLPVIRAALRHRPMTRIYLLCESTQCEFSESELEWLMVWKVLRKPISYQQMIHEIMLDLPEARRTVIPEDSAANSKPLPRSEMVLQDKDFVSIPANRLVSGATTHFDLYIRIRPNRYVKIIPQGEIFTPDRLGTYMTKGVDTFYVFREAQENYLQYCDQLAASVLANPRVNASVKASVVAKHGQEIANFLKHSGVSQKAIDYAQQFINNAHQFTTQLDPKDPLILNFLKDAVMLEHSTAISMITSLLIQPLFMQGDRSIQVVGLTTLLHDVALFEEGPKLILEDESQMDANEIEIFPSTSG